MISKRFEECTTRRGSDEIENLRAHSDEVLVLTVVHSAAAECVGSRLVLDRESVLTVGRDVTTGLKIPDERVSRLHLRIVRDPLLKAYRCGDAGSANGTFVNGLPIASAPLAPGDVIRLGDTLLLCARANGDWDVDDEAQRVARSALPVLILGETGTGKEVLARAIHEASGRPGPFVGVNCAVFPAELVASELFGHTRAAFSGAATPRLGLFRAAAGGSVLLDEIGDLPLELQPTLLRALQERSVRPLGSDHEVAIDARVISATHVDLEQAVRDRAFREDLLARLAQLVIKVPPLRERRGRILELSQHFAPGLTFSVNAAEVLLLGSWPRNVRELKAVMDSLSLAGESGAVIRASDLAERLPEAAARVLGRGTEQVAEPRDPSAQSKKRAELVVLLEKHGGNVAAVARELGKPRSHIYRSIATLGLSTERFRP